MKARRQISEFVNTEINSKKVLSTIAKNIRGGNSSAEESVKDDADSYAQEVTDRIVQSSSAILRGTIVDSASVNEDITKVTVVVYADRKSLNFANGIAKGN